MSYEARLCQLQLDLPPAPKPVGNYVGSVQVGSLLFMSGAGPRLHDGSAIVGKVGDSLTVDEGYQAARIVALNMLANIRSQIGSLDRIKRVVRTFGMVNCVPTLTETPKVINGFSDVFTDVFGDAGRGVRCAVGMAALPSQIAVEVEMVLELND